MTQVVIDTNVLVSGLIHPGGAPGRVIDLFRTGGLLSVVDDRILEEYADVLKRERFVRYFDQQTVKDILGFFRYNSRYVVCEPLNLDLPDSGDIPFLETAITSNAVLISGYLIHFPESSRKGATVCTPREFISNWG